MRGFGFWVLSCGLWVAGCELRVVCRDIGLRGDLESDEHGVAHMEPSSDVWWWHGHRVALLGGVVWRERRGGGAIGIGWWVDGWWWVDGLMG